MTISETDKPFGGGINTRLWLTILLVVGGIRLAVASAYSLYETECYYWLWSRHLAGGYFDHPPMLAWVNWLTGLFGPPHALAARLHAVISHTLATLFVFGIGRNLFQSARVGVAGAVIFNLIPIYGVMAVQNQPDVPLILFWTATVFCFERALSTGKKGWWLLAGVAAGGMLLSKFHGFFLVGCIYLHLLFFRADRKYVASPWPYLSLVVAVLCYLPNILWQSHHDWQTWRFQFMGQSKDPGFEGMHVVGTLVAPLGYLSPWVAGVLMICVVKAFTSRRFLRERAVALCLWTSLPFYLFFLVMSFRQNIKIHWPVISFVMLCPLAGALIADWTAKCRAWFVSVSATFTVLLYVYLVFAVPIGRMLPARWLPPANTFETDKELEKDWTVHAFGWEEFGEAIRDEVEPRGGRTWILSRRFDRSAATAFFAEKPELAAVLDPGPEYDQSRKEPDPRAFWNWPESQVQRGDNAIYVLCERDQQRWKKEIELVRRQFETVGEPVAFEAKYRGEVLRRFYYLQCEGFLGLPWKQEKTGEDEGKRQKAKGERDKG